MTARNSKDIIKTEVVDMYINQRNHEINYNGTIKLSLQS